MKILIVGLGSIGQRHLRNLKKINNKIKFLAVRKKFIVPILTNSLTVNKKHKNIQNVYKIQYFSSLLKALKEKPDAAFLCTPSKFHINETIQCLTRNCNVFIEKPLGSNNKNLSKLKKIYKKKNKLITMMGYQMRFNPIYNFTKKFLNSGKLGKIIYIRIFNGEHISDFHKYEDYKISYAARKSLGGGAILTQIHEIDYFLDLFKNYKITILSSSFGKYSNLKLDVEDTFNGEFLLKNKKNKFLSNIHLNFYTRPKKRYMEIFAQNGLVKIDFIQKKFEYFVKEKIFSKKFNFNNNKIFVDEIKFFIKSINQKKKISKSLSLANGIKTLEFALKLKKSRK